MNHEEAVAAERFIPMFLDRDLDMLETTNEKDVRPVAAAMAAVFVALVRTRIPSEQVSSAAAKEVLLDSDDNKIPAWIVGAAFRGALHEPQMLEGISHSLLIDTHLAYIGHHVHDVPAAERDQLVQAAVAVLAESREM